MLPAGAKCPQNCTKRLKGTRRLRGAFHYHCLCPRALCLVLLNSVIRCVSAGNWSFLTQTLIIIFFIPAAWTYALPLAVACSSCSVVGGPMQKLTVPVWTRPTGALGGSFPLMTRQKLKINHQNPIRSNPPPIKYVLFWGGKLIAPPHKQYFCGVI